MAAIVAAPFILGATALALTGYVVAGAITGTAGIVAGIITPFVVVVGLGPRFERTLYQDPNSPINQEFRGAAGVWPYGGGAVAVGFRRSEVRTCPAHCSG